MNLSQHRYCPRFLQHHPLNWVWNIRNEWVFVFLLLIISLLANIILSSTNNSLSPFPPLFRTLYHFANTETIKFSCSHQFWRTLAGVSLRPIRNLWILHPFSGEWCLRGEMQPPNLWLQPYYHQGGCLGHRRLHTGTGIKYYIWRGIKSRCKLVRYMTGNKSFILFSIWNFRFQ